MYSILLFNRLFSCRNFEIHISCHLLTLSFSNYLCRGKLKVPSLPPVTKRRVYLNALSGAKVLPSHKSFSDISQSCGKADFSSLGSSLCLSAPKLFLHWRPVMGRICAQALLGGPRTAQSQPSSSALPTELVTVANLLLGLSLRYCYTLGFCLLTFPHLGLFLLWNLIFLNMSMSNVHVSIFCSPDLSYLFNIHWNISCDIDWEDLVIWLKNCQYITGNKHNVLVSFLCELASQFFIKIHLWYLLCKISYWVKVFKVWCSPPTPINSRSLRTLWENPYKLFSRQSSRNSLK